MKLTIERKILLAALAAVKPAATAKIGVPILANVAILVDKKSLTVTATNLDLTLRAKVDSGIANSIIEPGETTVSCALLHDIVKSLNGEALDLELIKDSLRIVCGSSKFTLPVMDPGELPSVPVIKDAIECGIMENELHRLLAGTNFAHGEDDARMVLTGACLAVNGDFKSTACDSRRMATDSGELSDKTDGAFTIILPAQASEAIMKLLSTESDNSKLVNVLAGKNLVQFRFGPYTVISKIIEGEYPDVTKIIPDIKGDGITLGRPQLLEACQRIALVADGVRMDFHKQTLTLSARGTKQADAVEKLVIPETEDVTISMAVSYLIDALRAVDSIDIQILAKPEAPIIIKAPGRNWMAVIAGLKS